MASDSDPGSLVVVGASAGGVATLLELVESLPAGLAAPVCVVQHVGANPSLLPELLSHRGRLPALHPRDGQPLEAGTIYVAPPDRHLLVDGRVLRLSPGPREHHTRPAINPLFRSAAAHWGDRVIGVVLTGYLDDGTEGLQAIKAAGGVAVVEDPAGAYEPSMPLSALQHVRVDHCLPVGEIGPLIARLVAGRAAAPTP